MFIFSIFSFFLNEEEIFKYSSLSLTLKLIPFNIAREMTASLSVNLIPLTPTEALPEKTLRSLHENLIHFHQNLASKYSN